MRCMSPIRNPQVRSLYSKHAHLSHVQPGNMYTRIHCSSVCSVADSTAALCPLVPGTRTAAAPAQRPAEHGNQHHHDHPLSISRQHRHQSEPRIGGITLEIATTLTTTATASQPAMKTGTRTRLARLPCLFPPRQWCQWWTGFTMRSSVVSPDDCICPACRFCLVPATDGADKGRQGPGLKV